MIEYVFKCPVCGIKDTIRADDYALWKDPICEGEPPEQHERVTMKRHYTAPTVVWPKAERGH